jgi:hypothetical protein
MALPNHVEARRPARGQPATAVTVELPPEMVGPLRKAARDRDTNVQHLVVTLLDAIGPESEPVGKAVVRYSGCFTRITRSCET